MANSSGDFEPLRRLLKLKNWEQPPPGFFDRLPRQILARIEQEEGAEAGWRSWLSWLEFRPAVVGATGAAAAALYLFGLSLQERQEVPSGSTSGLRLAPATSMAEFLPVQSTNSGLWAEGALPVIDEGLLAPVAVPHGLPQVPKGLFSPGGPAGHFLLVVQPASASVSSELWYPGRSETSSYRVGSEETNRR